MSELSSVENRYLETLRHVDTFTQDVFGVPVIDQDFAPPHEPTQPAAGSLLSFSRRINKLADEISVTDPESIVMLQNLDSLNWVLRALAVEGRFDSSRDFVGYIARTMGVTPAMVPERSDDPDQENIQDQKRYIGDIVGGLGYKYTEDDREEFNRAHAMPAEAMQTTVEGLVDTAKDQLARILGTTLVSGLDDVDIEVVDVDDTWVGYFTFKNGKFISQFNSNPLLQISAQAELAIMEHEFTHGASSTTKHRLIAEGQLSPIMGILPCFSPQYFREEVTARAVEEVLFREQPGNYWRYLHQFIKYSNNIRNNMLIMANSGFFSQEEVAAYGIKRLPFEKPEKTAKDADLFANSLLFKTVFAVDAKSIEVGQRIAALPPAERQAVLGRLCTGGDLSAVANSR